MTDNNSHIYGNTNSKIIGNNIIGNNIIGNNIIIIDHGSYSCKYGFSGFSKPIGIISANGIIKNSGIQNINDMCTIWDKIIYEKLKIDPKKTKILLSLSNISDTTYYNKIKDIMLKKYMFNSIQIYNQQLLSLYSVGKNTGIVVDIGHDITKVVPIYDSHIIDYAIVYSPLTGKLINNYLKLEGIISNNYDKIKKNLIKSSDVKLYDVLLNPSIINYDIPNLGQIVMNAIDLCPIDLKTRLSQNIILIGGTSSIPGLCKELKKNINDKYNVKIFGPKNRHFASWIGGSTLCCLSTFNTKWIEK